MCIKIQNHGPEICPRTALSSHAPLFFSSWRCESIQRQRKSSKAQTTFQRLVQLEAVWDLLPPSADEETGPQLRHELYQPLAIYSQSYYPRRVVAGKVETWWESTVTNGFWTRKSKADKTRCSLYLGCECAFHSTRTGNAVLEVRKCAK